MRKIKIIIRSRSIRVVSREPIPHDEIEQFKGLIGYVAALAPEKLVIEDLRPAGEVGPDLAHSCGLLVRVGTGRPREAITVPMGRKKRSRYDPRKPSKVNRREFLKP